MNSRNPAGEIKFLSTPEEWTLAFPAFESLRPRMTLEAFLANRQNCLDGGYQLLGLVVDEKVVCVAGISVRPHVEHKRQLEIEDFSIHPANKRKGYGKQVLEWIVAYAGENNCFRIKIDSGTSREEAHLFYKSIGFSQTGFRFEKRF